MMTHPQRRVLRRRSKRVAEIETLIARATSLIERHSNAMMDLAAARFQLQRFRDIATTQDLDQAQLTRLGDVSLIVIFGDWKQR